ncbi:transglycosylase family protein [Streptomyces sp. TRM64462]|uniref:transglycosylase family protein n=1 Tax=Streptomyces sp. TRM64462 TaxID=2741726 RepID=UPI002815219A|nr:transglycosylase family protein [Streptomyces sp. TRM64462]
MTGSAIALPLLGAGSASAADAATWDRVAECETGGLWSADLGNGYYGGLQFSQETWQAYGGTAYAPRADLASRAEQMDVAEKVLAAQGAKAWETCAPIAGLTPAEGGTTSTDTDPGVSTEPEASPTLLPSPAPTTPTTPTAPPPSADADPSGTPEPSADPTAPAAPADPAVPDASTSPSLLPSPGATPATPESPAAPTQDAGTGSGTGKHRGEPAKEEGAAAPTAPEGANPGESGDSATGRENDRHPSRGDGTARGLDGAAADGTYTVQPGDNLWAIADTHELPGGWTALYDANRATVGDDPDLILPGQSLDLGQEQG